MKKKGLGLAVATEDIHEHVVEAKDYVSCGGSLHLSTGVTLTRKGVVAQDEILSLTVSDLQEIGRFGKGSSGSVKKVRHIPTGQIFAVKEIKLGGDRHLEEISKELSTLYKYKEKGVVTPPPPYIIDFKGAYSLDGSVFIALEAMDGSLMDLISPGKGVPEPILACILSPVLKGLNYLHKVRKLVHRDIKPQNVLFRRDGTIKITDFGVCSELESTKAGANSFVGTVTYMSPERLDGVQYSFSADIWGIGISVIQLATSEHPYEQLTASQETEMKFWKLVTHLKESPSPEPRGPGFSDSFKDFVARCLVKDKFKRATAAELLEHPWLLENDAGNDTEGKLRIEQWMRTVPQGGDDKEEKQEGMSQGELDSVLDKLMFGV